MNWNQTRGCKDAINSAFVVVGLGASRWEQVLVMAGEDHIKHSVFLEKCSDRSFGNLVVEITAYNQLIS